MDIEAILLTGGASRRMGQDKASLLINGKEQALLIADSLSEIGLFVTILGNNRSMIHINNSDFLSRYKFHQDKTSFAGPIVAISDFEPTKEYVFIVSCDIPRFDPGIVAVLRNLIGKNEAVIPMINGKLQPLCALYSRNSFLKIKKAVSNRNPKVMDWINSLNYRILDEKEMREFGLNPASFLGVNTFDELNDLLNIDKGLV